MEGQLPGVAMCMASRAHYLWLVTCVSIAQQEPDAALYMQIP